MKFFDLLIIGTGPAGLSAALYASKTNLNTVIVDGGPTGGKLLNTHLVDNYLGIENAKGFELAQKFLDHSLKQDNLINSNVKELLKTEDKIIAVLENDEKINAKAVIVATGMKPKKLDIDKYDQYFGKGISTCMVCDGFFYKNKNVAVVGGGLSATEESIYSKDLMKNIYIINIHEDILSSDLNKKIIENSENIKVFNNTKILKIIEDNDSISKILIENVKTNKISELEVEGIFTYIGWNPATYFIKNNNILNNEGFVNINFETMETEVEGIFAAGDITNKKPNQIITAASDGAVAFLSAKEYIDKNFQ